MFQLCDDSMVLALISSTTAEYTTHFTPGKAFMIADGAVNAECQTFKPPEAAEDEEEADSEGYPLCFMCEPSRRKDEVVEEMGQHEDGEVECWELERSQ